MPKQIPLSILDTCPLRRGETVRDALQQTAALARHAETLGFKRFWVTEHHGLPNSTSAAAAVVIGHIAERTSSIRVGSGGVMLPNHPPFVIAEQFGTLASLHPDRIDLGLGRASGTRSFLDDELARALRLAPDARERYPADVRALQSFFRGPEPGQSLRAIPGSGLDVPIWLLGSSDSSARLAASLGLPFVFASHIRPQALASALAAYRSGFQPSAACGRPHVMVCVFVIAANTDQAAETLFTSIQQMEIMSGRGMIEGLPPPIDDLRAFATPEEQARLKPMLAYRIVGARQTIENGLRSLVEDTRADEIMVLSFIHDIEARYRSIEIIAEAWDAIAP